MTEQNNLQQESQVMPSFFPAIASSDSKPLPSLKEFERIITQDSMTKARTEDYRRQMGISKALADKTKRTMPGTTISALMDGLGKALENVIGQTYLLQVDMDKIPAEKMAEVTARIEADPHTKATYTTASGLGKRIISGYDPLDDPEVSATELFDVMVTKAIDHYSSLLGLPADKQCVDITRMCGLAHDPKAYFNWEAEPFHVERDDLKKIYTQKAKKESGRKRTASRKKSESQKADPKYEAPSMDEAADHITDLLEQWGYSFERGRHNEYVSQFGYVCAKYDIAPDEAMGFARDHFSQDYPDTAAVMKSCYKHLDERGSWHFYRKGEKRSAKPSVKAVKQWIDMRYEMHHNVVTGFYELRSRNPRRGKYLQWTRIDDNIENTMWNAMDEDGISVAATRLHAVVNSDFSEPWDPLDSYLRSLPQWDGKDYIGELADRVKIIENSGFFHTQKDFRYFFKKWFVWTVVGWVTPREVCHTILILVGKGGINKTTFFYFLLPPCLREYFVNDSTAAYNDKDFQEAYSSKAVICLDEMEQSYGRNLSAFKSNMTKLVFSIRRPYDRYRSEMIHRASLCGTSNSMQLIGEDENRRFSPWHVEAIDDPRENPINYAQLYAQAVALGQQVTDRKGKGNGRWVYWLTKNDEEMMRRHNFLFMEHNFMMDQILRFFSVPDTDTEAKFIKFRYASEILEHIGSNPALSRAINFQNLSAVMEQMGFKKVRRKNGWGWLVVEKSPGEINTASMCSIDELSVLKEPKPEENSTDGEA